jgi:mannose-6-phosphate isomerase-like protein (cupin superfamily)
VANQAPQQSARTLDILGDDLRRYKISFDMLEWSEAIPGVRHKIYADGPRILRLVEYTSKMEPHWCSKGHVGLILDGRFEIEFHDSKNIFEAGDGVFIPSGEEYKHRATVLTDVVRAIFIEDV